MIEENRKNYSHLTLSDRIYIEHELVDGSTFSAIAGFLGKDPSTISKEVRRGRALSHHSSIKSEYECLTRRRCHAKHLCGDKKCDRPCAYCRIYDCNELCIDYTSCHCSRLEKPPYVCNGCNDRAACHLAKYYYKGADAQKRYKDKLTSSRSGINMDPDELKELNALVSPLIMNGQPLSHIFAVHADDIPCSMRTLYNYIDQGLLDARNLDLPRRVRFKKRRKHNKSGTENVQHYRIKRTYKDFEKYTEAFPDLEIVELDTVKGSREAGKCLMTLLFRRSDFMLIFLLNHCTQECVIACFNRIYDLLGHRLFKKTFPVILTDNGSEFKNPWAIEKSPDGKQRTKVFYCDPYISNQKGRLERNHEFIRYVIPKGRSMYFLDDEKVRLLTNHINSVARESLNNSTPFDMAELLLDKRIPALLGLKKVSPDKVLLKPALLK